MTGSFELSAKHTVGVVGLGMVGGTVERGLSSAGIDTRGYDRYKNIGSPNALEDCDVVFLCVPTPSTPDGGFELTEVYGAVHEVIAHLRLATIVAVKSTVPPGTCDDLQRRYPAFDFASMPEFLVASRPEETFSNPDRVIIGATTEQAAGALRDIMEQVAPASPAIVLKPRESELAKLCSNIMLAAKVAMANELAEVCNRFDVAWERVQSAVGLDRRIGPDHLTVTPERSFGGMCFPKDLDGLIAAARSTGYEPTLLEGIAEFNEFVRAEAGGTHSEIRLARGAA